MSTAPGTRERIRTDGWREFYQSINQLINNFRTSSTVQCHSTNSSWHDQLLNIHAMIVRLMDCTCAEVELIQVHKFDTGILYCMVVGGGVTGSPGRLAAMQVLKR